MIQKQAFFDLSLPSLSLGAMYGAMFGQATKLVPGLDSNQTLRDAAIGAAVAAANGKGEEAPQLPLQPTRPPAPYI